MKQLQVYAGPSVFGPWVIVESHIGAVTINIRVEPIGDTVVVGEVKYFGSGDSSPRIQPFFQQVDIQTGDVVANVEVRLKGTPTGSSCWVYVT